MQYQNELARSYVTKHTQSFSSEILLSPNYIVIMQHIPPKKINVNCICPCAIKTGMTTMIEENETMLKQTLMAIPAGRIGEPIDIANAALYLASDESDRHVHIKKALINCLR